MNRLREDGEVQERGDGAGAARLRRLAAGTVALLVAATIAACGGGDDAPSGTTGGSSAGTTAQTTATTPGTGAANGVADRTAEEILADATAAAQAAGSVHVSGQMDGVRLDLRYVRGKGAIGSVSQGADTVELIAIGDSVFLKAEEPFWRRLGGQALARLLAGKWLRAPARGGDFAGLAEVADMNEALAQALRPRSSSAISKGEVVPLDGTEAIGLEGSDGTLYVATKGDPLPVKIVGRGGRGEMVFAAWNEPFELNAPADAVDVSELEQAGSGS